jgi:hypothetical protein
MDHKHTLTTVHAIDQRQGIPYEVERVVCTACGRVVEERQLRRAVAA